MNNNQPAKKYPKGIFINKPFDNAPSFVKADISIHKDCLSEAYIQEYKEFINDKDYLKIQALEGDKGYYGALNNYKPKPKQEDPNATSTPTADYPEGINVNDIPF